MALKSQDVMVVLKLLPEKEQTRSFAALAADLGMSASEVHAAIGRLREGGLIAPGSHRVNRQALLNFLLHGVRVAFPAALGELTRGMPTAWASPAFEGLLNSQPDSVPVWADPEGSVRGPSVPPLYKSATKAAKRDSQLYSLLALADALRIGRARERALAASALEKRILTDG